MNQVIHQAVPRDLARTETALRAFPDGDAARARQLQGAWRNLHRELTHHHEAEDANIWPFLESRGVDASVLAQMESEHAAMKAALASVAAALDGLVAAPTADAAASAAEEVARAAAVTNRHLEHEENDVEPLIVALEDDPEWKVVAKRLRPNRVTDAANSLAWMQDGAGPQEQSSLRAAVPAPVLSVLTTLFARRYKRDVAPVWR